MREINEPECKTCGACCVGTDGDFVPVTALDKRRLPTKYVKKLQIAKANDIAPYFLPLKQFRGREACVALKGRLGKDINCDVYAQRPEFCRQFERGGKECHERRVELGLVPR